MNVAMRTIFTINFWIFLQIYAQFTLCELMKFINWMRPRKQYISQLKTWDTADFIGFDTIFRSSLRRQTTVEMATNKTAKAAFKVETMKLRQLTIGDILKFSLCLVSIESLIYGKESFGRDFGWEKENFKPILRVFDLYMLHGEESGEKNTLFLCSWCAT